MQACRGGVVVAAELGSHYVVCKEKGGLSDYVVPDLIKAVSCPNAIILDVGKRSYVAMLVICWSFFCYASAMLLFCVSFSLLC